MSVSAPGATNAQIADWLFISVRMVGSHLDRVRDKTGARRRADLTRLALTAGLVQPGRAAALFGAPAPWHVLATISARCWLRPPAVAAANTSSC